MWKITIGQQSVADESGQITIPIAFTNTGNNNSYSFEFRGAPNMQDFNRFVEENLVATQNKDTFLGITAGDYTLTQTNAPVLQANPVTP